MDYSLWSLQVHAASYYHNDQLRNFKISHDYFTNWYAYIVEKGCIEYSLDGSPWLALNEGELLLCSPFSVLDKRINDVVCLTMLSYNTEGGYSFRASCLRMKVNERIMSTLEIIKKLKSGRERRTEQYVDNLLMDVWYQICMESTAGNEKIITESSSSVNSMSELLRYIENNIDRDLSLSQLSAVFSCTQQTLISRFKAFTGCTPGRYVSVLRVNKAKKLLPGSYTLKEIAALCGYSNEYYLSSVFKNITGMTPSAFRHKYRAGVKTV